jgi:hypothetical protein
MLFVLTWILNHRNISNPLSLDQIQLDSLGKFIHFFWPLVLSNKNVDILQHCLLSCIKLFKHSFQHAVRPLYDDEVGSEGRIPAYEFYIRI